MLLTAHCGVVTPELCAASGLLAINDGTRLQIRYRGDHRVLQPRLVKREQAAGVVGVGQLAKKAWARRATDPTCRNRGVSTPGDSLGESWGVDSPVVASALLGGWGISVIDCRPQAGLPAKSTSAQRSARISRTLGLLARAAAVTRPLGHHDHGPERRNEVRQRARRIAGAV